MIAALACAALAMPCMAAMGDPGVMVTQGPPGPCTLYLAVFDGAETSASGRAVWAQKVEQVGGTAVGVRQCPAGARRLSE